MSYENISNIFSPNGTRLRFMAQEIDFENKMEVKTSKMPL